MQLQKLIRLLQEAKIKHGDRIEVCLDSKYMEANRSSFIRYLSIPDVEVRSCIWNEETVENPQERNIIVLGNY